MQFAQTFTILVKTNMPRTEVIEFDKERNAYRMNVHARPEAGKANVEIMKYFKKEYKLNIEIISGFTSREKLVKIIQ